MAGAAGLAAILGLLASPGAASPRPGPPAGPGPSRIGMNSCAARGCHGAVDATDPARGRVYIKDGAYTTWLHYDPHARAYAALLEPRSVKIADGLGAALGGRPAHEATLCLACHATVGPPRASAPEAAPLSDGISCEACHGLAEAWRDKHLAPAWRALPAASKALDGLVDLGTPSARARSCVGCHVGDRSRGMDVNHDLIAAGHPRLNFEFASYQAAYPKHWKEKTPPGAFEAKSWAIGQAVTAVAVLDLLAARALASEEPAVAKAPAPEAAWPEFSEYECFACHHDLTNPSPRQRPGHAPGRLPWQAWPSAMLPELGEGDPGVKLDAWSALGDEMSRPQPRRDRAAGLAARGKQQLNALIDSWESDAFELSRVDALLKGLASRRAVVGEGWDRAAQRSLALEALARASKAMGLAIDPAAREAIRDGSKGLDFPLNYDSPRTLP